MRSGDIAGHIGVHRAGDISLGTGSRLIYREQRKLLRLFDGLKVGVACLEDLLRRRNSDLGIEALSASGPVEEIQRDNQSLTQIPCSFSKVVSYRSLQC
jgi:hypothetical protein